MLAELKKLESLPTLPSIAARVIDATLSEDSTPEGLSVLIESDQALTLKVLRVANSAFYRRSGQVWRVKDAILLMGLNAIKSLVLSISVYELFDKVESRGGIDRRQFWVHSLAVAICSRLVSARCKVGQPEEAFVAGLLHDVGKLIMDHISPRDYLRVMIEAREGGLSLLEAERRVFGYDHTTAGKWALERWQMPERLLKSVWFHHQAQFPGGEDEVFDGLAAVVGLADGIANECGCGFDLCLDLPGVSMSFLKKLSLSRADVDAIGDQLKEGLPQMADLFGLELPSREEYIKWLQRSNLELGRLSLELEQANWELSGKLSERAALYGMAQKLASRLDFDEIAELLAESAIKGLKVKAARCVLRLNKRRTYLVEMSLGGNGRIKKSSRVMELGQAMGESDAQLDGGRWANVDIVSKGDWLGSLSVMGTGQNGDGLRGAEESLSALAKIGAVALDNARLYMQLQDRSEKLARAHQKIGMAFEEVSSVQEKMAHIERLKAFGELAGGLAHNFNNLLGMILGRTQLMLSRCVDEELCRELRLMERCALDGAQMVKRIQRFGKREGSEGLSLVDVDEVVRDTVAMTENRWKARTADGGEIAVQTSLGRVPPVRGNRAELCEVLVNIILNAIDAMPSGGKISVSTGAAASKVFIRISDTGKGMSKEVMEKIFNPFFTTKGAGGTGLGLSISYSIIARHRGEIKVESQQGKGSIFTVTLPAANRAGHEEDKVEAKKQSGPKGSILVIDDEKGMREVLYDILVASGHKVEVAEDGEKGLAIFKGSKNDLVITDLAMMGLSGLDVAKAVKQIQPATKILLLTGWGVQLDDKKLQGAGVNLVISKPFTLSDLNKAVSDLLTGP